VIDVVIPVYRGERQSRACIDSVLRQAPAQRNGCRVIVVDDASPEPGIVTYLDELARTGAITLLRNDANIGFVASVNRGMSVSPDSDVVLLNSDTEVANDWLDRLHAAATHEPDVGTVTPFSNNATICSYPFHGWQGGIPGTLSLAELDALAARVNAGRTLDIPTGVGFCLYIRRPCLAEVGPFDEARFGRGYGEENDFCMRAASKGWRNVLAADVFVFHHGSVSFEGDRGARVEAATAALLEVHPDYTERVQAFVARDPTRPFRDAIDRARVAYGAAEAGHVLDEREAEHAQAVRVASLEAELARALRLLAEARESFATADARAGAADAELVRAGQRIAELDAEIVRLRAGLAHAERLAFGHAAELERIRRTWLGRCLATLARMRG
jgi:GT2 family glycosyltransferase